MDGSSSFVNLVQEALRPELCLICGNNHNTNNCDYIKISNHVPDKPIPPRAKLSLPDFLHVQRIGDGSYKTVTNAPISKGTRFGPFHAEKSQVLEPSVDFPLKIFASTDIDDEWYLSSNNEETCSWLMYVGFAEDPEEQNLICYQEKGEIYYVAIKEINIGEVLKVWYSPYYAFKINKSILLPKPDNEETVKNVDVNSLIKKQQKIMERKTWTCKFCSHIENGIASFARHILKHYTAQHRNMCEMCKKSFGSKKHLKNHMKIVHRMFSNVSPPKPAKNFDFSGNSKCGDVALGGPLLNDMFTDSTDLQQTDLNQFDLNLDNQNLLLDNLVETILNDNVKDLDHFNFEIDDNQKQFICDICLKQFTKVKLLIIHLRHHTGDYMCFKCLKIFCRKENLKCHTCNLTSRHRCKICDRTFTQKKYLSRHIDAAHDRKYHCVSCSRNYHSNKELADHNCSKVVNSDKERFSCPICNKHFFRNRYLKKHLQLHGPRVNTTKTIINVTCEICGLTLESRNSYYLHKKKHQEPMHSCETCNKKFYRKDILKEHLLTHQDYTPFECDTCKRKFKTLKLLSKHRKKVHESFRPVRCTICDVSFKAQSTLNKHMKNLHSTNPERRTTIAYYSCPVCHKSIKLKSSVHRHLKRVHSDVTGIDLRSLKPRIVVNSSNLNKIEKNPALISDNNTRTTAETKKGANNREAELQNELDEQIDSLLTSAENNLSIQKDAVDSLVEELEIDGKKEQKETREVCLSIPDLADNYQEITLDRNAYILDNGTIVQPQGNSDNVVIYVLDQAFP